MAKDPETRAHQEWLGPLQPVGLVVSPPALVKAQAVVQRNAAELQKRLRGVLRHDARGKVRLPGLEVLAREILGWEAGDLVGGEALPAGLEVALPEHEEVLRPTHAVPDVDKAGAWVMLVQELPEVDDVAALDEAPARGKRGWHASPQIRMERLLRDTGVGLGLLCTPVAIRMVVAPAGESSGHMTFPAEAMAEVPGRTILAALHMLLCAERMFTLPPGRRLPAIVAESRKYQNVVSTQLAEQVLRALGELLRGFQAADEATDGRLLGDVVREDPQHVYGGLITVLMRLVFLLYAEEREMLPGNSVYVGHYSVGGLFEKLRADAGLYPDTMDQRYGAWARLLSLFRLVFDGGGHGGMWLPARHGQLFHPDEYAFLEGRPKGEARQLFTAIEPPRVSDGVVYRVLEDLLMLDGERLSYRSLDVEQIGSVYEAVMGFEVKRATGASIGVRPQHVVVDLGEVLKAKGKARVDVLEAAGCKLGKAASEEVKAAGSVEDVVAAIGKKVSPQTPRVLPVGSLYLQPTEERRRSGSHYTPRSLTEPIVRTTLRPVLEGLGERASAEKILGLKVCDPAMGSGAFLVEACRHLAEKVVAAWERDREVPEIGADEDVLLHARRLVAQRCLYGVDKNPFAVGLAKLSLWLVTLARDHAFTFLDHALKCGDSLVGLTRRQIAAFHWDASNEHDLPLFQWLAEQVGRASVAREDITRLGDGHEAEKRVHLREAEEALQEARLTGNLVTAAYFSTDKEKDRERRRLELWGKVCDWRQTGDMDPALERAVRGLQEGTHPVLPLHWEVEFSEIFNRQNPGFDAFVGNPPFIGGTIIGGQLGLAHHDYLIERYQPATGLADIVAFFLRRCFDLLRRGGTFGLIATNTVAQGDTRSTGLVPIVQNDGFIYQAQRRYKWPGEAAVVTSLVHVIKARPPSQAQLDGKPARRISSFLLNGDVDTMPVTLSTNKGMCYLGTKIWGAGFVFEDNPSNGSSSIEDMHRILAQEPRSKDIIYTYMGGQEFNASPTQSPNRFVIDFGEMTEVQARQWKLPFAVVEERVRPIRLKNEQRSRREGWWLHANRVQEAAPYVEKHGRLLAVTSVSKHLSVAFAPPGTVLANTIILFLLHKDSDFAILQSRAHEIWARLMGSSMKDDLRYTTPCFDTFPLPAMADRTPLDMEGARYYTHRADLMVRNNEGLTATYNRFHDPDETSTDILRLRELHDAMDRAVLDAYGWTDIQPRCEFLLDYEEDEDEETTSRRRKPWRYRWPDEVQEEVLARLLDLNQKRAEEERLAGAGADAAGKGKGKKAAKQTKAGARKTIEATTRAPAAAAKDPSAANDGEWKSTKKKRSKKNAASGNLELLPNDEDAE